MIWKHSPHCWLIFINLKKLSNKQSVYPWFQTHYRWRGVISNIASRKLLLTNIIHFMILIVFFIYVLLLFIFVSCIYSRCIEFGIKISEIIGSDSHITYHVLKWYMNIWVWKIAFSLNGTFFTNIHKPVNQSAVDTWTWMSDYPSQKLLSLMSD